MNMAIPGALALALSPALAAAQDGSSEESASAKTLRVSQGQLLSASMFEGGQLYVTGDPENEGWTSKTIYEEIGDGWTEVGTIADIVISQDSSYAGIVGKLDGKNVFVSIQDIALIRLDGSEIGYVTKLGEEDLAKLEPVDEDTWK